MRWLRCCWTGRKRNRRRADLRTKDAESYPKEEGGVRCGVIPDGSDFLIHLTCTVFFFFLGETYASVSKVEVATFESLSKL